MALTPPSSARRAGSSSASTSAYPRIISALEMLAEDDDPVYCGCPSSDAENDEANAQALLALGIEEAPVRNLQRKMLHGSKTKIQQVASRSSFSPLPLASKGQTTNQDRKFICTIPIGIEDDSHEFSLVKRILGKEGNIMKVLARDYNAKIRLRGRGSGYRERDGIHFQEADMPLRIDVSCIEYGQYREVIQKLVAHVGRLHEHYKRYARSKGWSPPTLRIEVEELRRDDLGIDSLRRDRHIISLERGEERRNAEHLRSRNTSRRKSPPRQQCHSFKKYQQQWHDYATGDADISLQSGTRYLGDQQSSIDYAWDAKIAEQVLAMEIQHVLEGGPMPLTKLAAYRDFAMRYNIIQGKPQVRGHCRRGKGRSWTKWLLSLPGVHIAENPRVTGSYLPSSEVWYSPPEEPARCISPLPDIPSLPL